MKPLGWGINYLIQLIYVVKFIFHLYFLSFLLSYFVVGNWNLSLLKILFQKAILDDSHW